MTRRQEPRDALLLAAHGERRPGAGNQGLRQLAGELCHRRIADEVAFGLIASRPSIAEAFGQLRAAEVLVYPLFLAPGWFARVRLPQALAAIPGIGSRKLRILDPLGLEPALVDLVARKAATAARARGLQAHAATVVLLAHGSTNDAASRTATEELAVSLNARRRFRGVRIAMLEGAPEFAATIADIDGPSIVVGLFAGEGLHGAQDVPRLVQEAANASFAGNIGASPEIADVVAAGVRRSRTSSTGVPTTAG